MPGYGGAAGHDFQDSMAGGRGGMSVASASGGGTGSAVAGHGGMSTGGTAGGGVPSGGEGEAHNAGGEEGDRGGEHAAGGSSGGQGGRDPMTGLGGSRGGASGSSGGFGGILGMGGTPATCSPGRIVCGGVCLDPSTNDSNCGDCANACSTAQTCTKGRCALRDGQSCATAQDCASGVCSFFFRDEDGDGYGAPSNSIGRCSITTPPPGYASNSRDCCDNGGNVLLAAKIHPGADFQSVSADGLCGVTWDYDCSGGIETNPDEQVYQGCSSSSASSPDLCVSTYLAVAQSSCGAQYPRCYCGSIGVPNGYSCTDFCPGFANYSCR